MSLDISHLDKAEVLAALYNHSKQQGMGFLDERGREPMTVEAASLLLDAGHEYFDYLHGRVMKISLASNDLKTALYNRDNGEGMAERAIATIETKAA